jgi:hypothetical protein
MSVGDAITCEFNNCVDEEIKTVSARHAEAFEALEHLFVLSSYFFATSNSLKSQMRQNVKSPFSKIQAISLKFGCCSRRLAVASRPAFTSRPVAI